MKYLTFILAFFSAFNMIAQSTVQDYDKELADSLGADQYGMKSYLLVILSTGKDTAESKEKRNEYFRGHVNNINQMAEEGKLIVAGPLSKNEN